MKPIDEESLREILKKDCLQGPRAALVAETKRLMREELLLAAEPVEVKQKGMIYVLAVLVVLICLNLFYMAAVGTILEFALPSSMAVFIRHSMIGVSVAGASLVSGAAMLIFFKMFQAQKVLSTKN